MRRKFTTLCLALVGALMASPAFAQGENVTFKLKNADMEQGLKGWTVGGVDIMSKNKKDVSSRVGFHGMNQGVLETWHYTQPRGDSYAMQHVKGLPNGTYVFGAYVGAARQVRNQAECNHDTIQGVSLFANEAVVPVATCNPDLGNYKWAHSSKFNVATQVIDGSLEVGIRIEGTNANYVVWDNATLYYFGNMSAAEALDAMAEMDMDNAVAIADTLVSVKMNVDSLANLQNAIATAKTATTTAATLWADNEDLYWWVGKARKSEDDYKTLDEDIQAAKVIRGGTWTQGSTSALLPILDATIASAEQAYAEATLDRPGLTALRKELNWAAGDVKADSVYAAKNDLYTFMLEIMRVLNRPGGYTSTQLANLSDLELELNAALNSYKNEVDAKLPLEERTINPMKDLIPYIERVYTAIENVRNHSIANEYTRMPIKYMAGDNGWVEGTEMYNKSLGIVAYTSPLYLFNGKVETFRITVNKTKKDQNFFCLSGLEFYDRYGTKIDFLENDYFEDNVTTNADHNSLNAQPDGGGIRALFDDDDATFFHSAWQNGPSEAHYLEVTLPDGGYDAFSFRMLGRYNGNGFDQSHTFPAEMIISTPMPSRDALMATFNKAMAQYPYLSGVAEPGFYKADFSALNRKIAEVEAALEGNPSEEECDEMNAALSALMTEFEAADHSAHMPEAGKAYRVVSAFPAFYEKQGVHKAITFNEEHGKLWWENANADSVKQEFVFEPVLDEEGEHFLLFGEYLYTMQHVETELYVAYDDGLFVLTNTPDSIGLVPLSGGQFAIYICDFQGYNDDGSPNSCSYEYFHAGDHYSGNSSDIQGNYGGIYGIGSGICSYSIDGINHASAWYIREMAEMPWTVSAGNTTGYRSEYIHMYEPASTIFLTAANKNCAFEGLTIYDLCGNIVPATIEVEGREATVVLETKVTSFSFALNNKEKVKMFTVNTLESHPLVKLQAAYDAAVAVAPVKGVNVGMYADLSEYEAALAYAESLLAGGASDETLLGAIETLNEAVANLVPNMPDSNRSYYIVSAADEFMQIHGTEMMVYANNASVEWTYANTIDANRYWQFEQVEDAYYLKNVGADMYLGYKLTEQGYYDGYRFTMFEERSNAIPFVISVVQNDVVTISPVNNQGLSLHVESHDSGKGKTGNIICYNKNWDESQWRICEVEAYEFDYAMYMFRANAKAGESTKVTIEMENPTAVTAVEFDLCLPEGVTLDGVAVDNVRVPVGCIVGSALQGDNVYRISLEMNEGALVGYSGAVFNLTLQTSSNMAGEYAINLSNIVVTPMAGEEATVADFASSIVVTKSGDATCIDAVETTARIYGVDGAVVAVCDADMQLGVYTIAGQLVKQWNVEPGKNTMALPAGIYLINGHKAIVK